MSEQNLRDQRIASKLNLEKLPYKLKESSFKNLGAEISNFIDHMFIKQKKTASINWCFANIKKIKIFLQIFHANENGKEIYKEEIAKNIPEYSYKTIARIINEGIEKGYYVLLDTDGIIGNDGKIKNIRPSEALIADFLNLGIEIISYIDKNRPK